MPTPTRAIDTEKYRLRRFVERLVEIGEVEIHAALLSAACL